MAQLAKHIEQTSQVQISLYYQIYISPEDEQSILFEKLRPQQLFSEPTLVPKEIYTWLYPQVYYTEQNYKRPMWHFETFISLRGCKIY